MNYAIYLEELKDYLKVLHNDDDNNLTYMLERGHAAIEGYCGEFAMEDVRGRTLVFDYVRFDYNGQSDYFYDSFRPELNMYGFQLYDPSLEDELYEE